MTRCRVTWQNYVRNYFKRLRDPLVTHYHISCLPSPVSLLLSSISLLQSPVYHLSSPISHLLSPVYCLLSLFYRLSSLFVFTPLPSLPLSPWNPGVEGRDWPPAGVEDDHWAGRGEFDRKKEWRMTALEGEGWVWKRMTHDARWRLRGKKTPRWRVMRL